MTRRGSGFDIRQTRPDDTMYKTPKLCFRLSHLTRNDDAQPTRFHTHVETLILSIECNTVPMLYHESLRSRVEMIFNLWIFAYVRYEVCAFQALRMTERNDGLGRKGGEKRVGAPLRFLQSGNTYVCIHIHTYTCMYIMYIYSKL